MGFIRADGPPYSIKDNESEKLYDVIGFDYTDGPGPHTHFKVPNLTGRAPFGADNIRGNLLACKRNNLLI